MRPLFLLLSPKQEAMEALLACTYHITSLSSKGKDWVQCTGALDPLRSWHVSSFVQFLYMCQNLNGSSAFGQWTQAVPLWFGSSTQDHWTHWDLDTCPVYSSFCTCVKISTSLVLLCTGPKPLPFKGKGLGPVHRSTGRWDLDTCLVLSMMGCLGKTTLAKKVYHHSDVRHHFEGFAWAYITQQCKTRDVWEGIFAKLTFPTKDERDQILKIAHDELAKKLNQVQQEKRCLVILDDIWSTEAWDLLSSAFPSG